MAPKEGGLLPVKKKSPAYVKAGLFFLLISSLYITPLLAETLSVSGDRIDYNANTKGIEANHNVDIWYGPHHIQTSKAIFDVPSQNVTLPEPFNYNQENTAVSGASMVYNFKTHEGIVNEIEIKADKTTITGRSLDIDKNRLAIEHLKFTTCEKDTPDYEVHSEIVHFYPQVGFMVAFNNTLYTQFLPFPIWIPTYIYGSRSYSIIGSSSAVPEIGANKREGLYLKHRVGYYFNERSTGTIDLGVYLQRGGYWYGFTHLEEVSNSSEVHISAHMVGHDGFEGLAAYYTDLITMKQDSDEEEENNTLFGKLLFKTLQDFKNDTATVASRLHTGIRYRQLLNDSRVSHLPFVKLMLHDTEIVENWKLSGNVGWAHVKEETENYTFQEGSNTHSQLSLDTTYPIAASTNIGTTLISDMNWYDNQKTWQRLFASFYLDFQVIDLQPRLFYIKKLMDPYGESPFEYEKKYATVSDEVGARINFPLLGLEWGYEVFYNLDEKRLRTQNIHTSIPFDCWKLTLKTNTIQGTFSFGVELF